MSDHKRIYIGGLTPDISQDDVSGRFRPFGQVLSCEIIKAKEPEADSNSCRGFAYVTLQPKDEASLARMLSLYNGCKWRGQRLRVELAKPDYLTRLQQEWQDEKQLQQQAQTQQQQEQEQQQQQQQQQPAQVAEAAEDAHILRLTVPGSKHKVVTVDLTSKSKSHRAWFPAAKMKRPAELDWEPLPPTKRATMQAAADACVPLLDAATAAQQLAATQELLARIAEQQRQQQRVLVVPQAEGEGVEVAFSYQQQQQPQQQTSGKKNASRVVEQELMSQLKLLKRISEREQHEQAGRISGSSRVVEFLDAAADSPGMQQAAGNGGVTGTAHADTEADDSDSDGAPVKQGSNNRQQQQQQQQQSRLQPVPAKQQRQQGQQLKQNIKQQQQQQEKEGVSELSSEPAADSGVSDMSELSGDSSDYESDQWEQWLAAEGLAEEQEGEGQQQQQPLKPPAADKAAHRQPQQQQRVAKQKGLPRKQPPTKQQQQQQLKPQPGKASSKHPVPAAATTAAVNKAAARVPAATQPKAPAAQPKLPPAQPKAPAEAPSPPPAAAAPPPAAWDLDRFGSDSEEVLVDDDSDTAPQGPPAAGSRPTGAKGGRPRGDVLLCPVVKTNKGVGRV